MVFDSIIGFFKKNFTWKDILLISLVVILYLTTRLINLTHFPIFNDEGIYIQWAKTAWHDASWRFISLTDGKQPLQTWMTIPFLKLFPNNALLAGRLFAVSTGFIALTGVFSLLFYLFNKKTAYIGSLLYIFTPYFLFYDRLALTDSAVNAGFIWIFLFSILLAKKIRLDIALLFGFVAGFSLLTKSSAQVFLGLAGLAPVLFITKQNRKQLCRLIRNYYFLYLIVCAIALGIYNVQRLSPFLHFVSEKNKVFVIPFLELLKSPFQVLSHNLTTLPLYVSWEMGFVLAIIGIVGWLFLWKKNKSLFLYFSLWLIILYIGVSFVTIILYPRYLIFFASLLMITTAYLLASLKNKFIKLTFICFLIISFLYFDSPILFDVKAIPFPPVDRGQYLEGWTAGWGIKDIMEYAREKSKEKPVIILAEGDFGMSGDVLNVFMRRNDKIFIKGYWPLTEKDLIANQKELQNNYVFIVISHQDIISNNWPMKLINRYEKPGNQSTIYLLELTK